MTDYTLHTPTPEFRARLADEVARTFRRESRFAALRRERRGRFLRVAAIVIASLGIGAASGLASAQVRDVVRRDSLLQSAHAELRLIVLRLELARAAADDALRKERLGAAGPEAVAQAQAELRELQAKEQKARLNIEEIRATSQPPRDELTAPRAGRRDFVEDRIELQLAAAQERLTDAERAHLAAKRRLEIGLVDDATRIEAEVELARARAELAVLADRRELRREFLEKGTAADELARRLEVAQLRHEIAVAEQSLQLAKVRLDRVRKQLESGVSSRLEMMRAEVRLQEAELELRQLFQRRERLNEVRRDP